MPATSIRLPPTYLSSLVMLAVLPATWIPAIKRREACDLSFVSSENYSEGYDQFHQERKDLENEHILVMEEWLSLNDTGGEASKVQALEARGAPLKNRLDALFNQIEGLKAKYWKHPTNIIHSDIIDGIETFTVEPCADSQVSPHSDPDHQIFFCGNGQDAQDKFHEQAQARRKSSNHSTHYTYWNYPGVARSTGAANSTDDLVEAGYKQVKRLLNDNISADKITLYGHSLGGGVAAQVAKRLHKEGYLVHLTIDRSFSRVASVIPEVFAELNRKYLWLTLIMPIITLSISGLALGVVTAGLIASIGAVLASLTTPMITPYINNAFNLAGSIAGAAIGLSALIIGAIVGVALGVLISIQHIWTDKPYTPPMTPAFSALLQAARCDMDSVNAVRHIILEDSKLEHANKTPPKIEVINTVDDNVIYKAASLNEALGFKPGEVDKNDEDRQLQGKITSFWYRKGGHCRPLKKADNIPAVESSSLETEPVSLASSS
ncbi:MAG: hypothetical protein P1U36_02970 [Legionellaceae bacterium]|nr:hypothetical protein [Legionellaceae bacterium]